MWLQLGMAGLKAMQDQKNKQNDLASNVITQKYSPWTGQAANFASQGKGSGLSTMIGGLGAGMLQDKLDAAEQATKQAEWKSDADFYKPGGVGTPVASKPATGGFAAMAQRAPATAPAVPAGNASSFEPNFVMPEAAPGAGQQMQDFWSTMATKKLTPHEMQAPQAPAVDPTATSRQSLWNMLPNNMPLKRGY